MDIISDKRLKTQPPSVVSKRRFALALDIRKNWQLYLMVLPVVLFFAVFMYGPMYGAIIAFKDFLPKDGIWGSEWVGLKHFTRFFHSLYFLRVLKNTFLLSLYSLLWGFPAPILLALLLNELRHKVFKSVIQTVTYLPHFISMVVIIGLMREFTVSTGLFNDFLAALGLDRFPLMQLPSAFRTLYIASDIWQNVGWNSIIYLAALAGINPQLYEAARIDGANRLKQILHVTLPSIRGTIMIMLILRIGTMLTFGYEKIILMYDPSTYSVADVISSYVYRMGLQQMNYSYSTAVGLFNSVVNFVLLVSANKLSRVLTKSGLW